MASLATAPVVNYSSQPPNSRYRWRSSGHLSSGAYHGDGLAPISEGRFVAGRGSIRRNLGSSQILSQPFYLPSYASSYTSLQYHPDSINYRKTYSSASAKNIITTAALHPRHDTNNNISMHSVRSDVAAIKPNLLQHSLTADKLSDAPSLTNIVPDKRSSSSGTVNIRNNATVNKNSIGRGSISSEKPVSLLIQPTPGSTLKSELAKRVSIASSTISRMGTLTLPGSIGDSQMSLRRRKKQYGANVLAERDIFQVELMYQSQATKMFVCRCLVNLYYAKAEDLNAKSPNWELHFTGIPLVILDMGCSKARSKRQLQLVLAEKGTGFALWRDNMDTLSKFSQVEKTFHTMLHSKDHRVVVGLSYDNAYAAGEMQGKINEFINELVESGIGERFAKINEKRGVERRRSFATARQVRKDWLRKANISTPCCFQHITSIRPADLMTQSELNSEATTDSVSTTRRSSTSEAVRQSVQSPLTAVNEEPVTTVRL